MNRTTTTTNGVAVAFALAVAAAGIAHADDSSMARFGGDSYAYFHETNPMVRAAPSAFRKENPHGLAEGYFQSLSSEGPEWDSQPVVDKTIPPFRRMDPKGLTFRDYQALSSNDSMWQVSVQPSAIATTNAAIAGTK